MRSLVCASAVAASRDLFLAHPVPQQQFLAEPVPAAYTSVAGPYAEFRVEQAPTQDAAGTDFLGATCAVAMFAVIGYSVGRSTSQQRKPLRAKPVQPRLGSVVMQKDYSYPFSSDTDTSSYTRGDVNKMPGTYQWSINGSSKVFDPLNLASKYDVNWLREAELKHGRVTMLATVGFLANDLGLKFPQERFQGISSVDAHDAMVQTGDMWYLLAFVGACELVHASKIVPRLDGDWSGWEPGNYGVDPLNWANDDTREAELKHGRLAMMAFGGLVTQSALGYDVTTYF